MTADLLVYMIIAAGLVFWLKSILGNTDDEDDEKREDLFKAREKQSQERKQNAGKEEKPESFLAPISKKSNRLEDNIVRLNALSGQNLSLPRHVFFDNKTAENNLDDIAITKPDFDLAHFLEGAEYAFPMIIEAFAEGDLETLEDVLDAKVFEGFKAAIEARNEKGESVTTEVKSIERIDIVEAFIKDEIFFITVRFHANEICVIRNSKDEIISGDPDKVTQMVDVWVFGQPEKSKGPEWYLYETRDDEAEDHKTPIPDAGETK